MSTDQQDAPLGLPDLYATITSKLAEYGSNAKTNIATGVNSMNPQSWIRLVIIAGGYMLLRRYVIRHSQGAAVRKLRAEHAEEKGRAAEAKVSPNELRGLRGPSGEDSGAAAAGADEVADADADERAEGTGVDWGSRARVKQRKFLRQMLEQEERRRLEEQEDEEDEDIKQFLID